MKERLGRLDWSGETVRDPIWHDIRLSVIEQDIIHTPAFSRLRDIHQLGFAYLSYTGANHTRFEHCIGTMEAADRIFHMVNFTRSSKPFSLWRPEKQVTAEGVDAFVQMRRFRQALRICALLHDAGHPPYSHACESLLRESPDLLASMYEELQQNRWQDLPRRNKAERQLFAAFRDDSETLKTIIDCEKDRDAALRALGDHETYTKLAILSPRHGIRPVLERWAAKKWNIPKTDQDRLDRFLMGIAWLAAGKYPPVGLDGEAEILYPIASFIDGDLDVDKIDYIARDNYHCGLPYELDWRGVDGNVYIQKSPISGRSPRFHLTFGREALFFLASIVSERFRFGYHVHNETWNTFLERDIVAKLRIFMSEYGHKDYSERRGCNLVSKKIIDLHTKWEDGELRFYLSDQEHYLPTRQLLWQWGHSFSDLMAKKVRITKRVENGGMRTVREDARIDIGFDEICPPVRKMVYVLGRPEIQSNTAAKACIDSIETALNKGLKKRSFVLYFYSVRPLRFTALLHGTKRGREQPQKKILDDQIIRGVMNETLKQYGVCVLGPREVVVPTDSSVACKDCQMYAEKPTQDPDKEPHYQLCVRVDPHDPKKIYLIDGIVQAYRRLCGEVCAAAKRIIITDLILKVLQQCEVVENRPGGTPRTPLDGGTLCRICYHVAAALAQVLKTETAPEAVVFGKGALSDKRGFVPYEFHQELRSCVYFGMVDAVRDIVERQCTYKPFRRRYRLSLWGRRYFVALDRRRGAYGGYLGLLREIEDVFTPPAGTPADHPYAEARREIEGILAEWQEECAKYQGRYADHLDTIERAALPL